MFYLGLENQIHLLIIVIFSSYLYLSSIVVKSTASKMKLYGTTFFISLSLSALSFFSLNRELAYSYLFFAEFVLITVLLLILLFEKNKDYTSFLFFLLYAIPLGIVVIHPNLVSLSRSPVINLILLLYTGILVIVIVSCTFLKQNSRSTLFWGILSLCASLLLRQVFLKEVMLILALLLKTAGYVLFSSFFYRSTIFRLEASNSKNSAQLNQINQNVQREVSRRVEEIERSNRKLVEIAKTDHFTGAYTKRAIMDIMDNMMTKDPNKEFSIVMFDIDDFKSINDKHGHIVGDNCIKNLINITRNSLRGDDKLGRFGGDEFVILLPETNPVKAYLVADRFRKNVEQTKDPHFTISVGVASFPLDAKNAKALLNAVDKALYASKESGKNQVTHTNQLNEVK